MTTDSNGTPEYDGGALLMLMLLLANDKDRRWGEAEAMDDNANDDGGLALPLALE